MRSAALLLRALTPLIAVAAWLGSAQAARAADYFPAPANWEHRSPTDAGFDPALRAWLARPFGRLFFAGEHTSIRWQGYMNGAIESGRRAAEEIASEA